MMPPLTNPGQEASKLHVVARIKFLDGLRGIAILSVLIFHAYVAMPENLPFGDRYGVAPIRLGWVGVQLFFLISGFVILLTLEHCDGAVDFVTRRWLRLFPAMLVSSAIILIFDGTAGIGPFSQRTFSDVIPGLLFVSPALINAVTGFSLQSLDTPFWSLYVEVVFYALFGLAYFSVGSRSAIALIASLAIICFIANGLTEAGYGGNMFGRFAKALDWIGFSEFGWFASGALFYKFFVTKRNSLYYMAILTAIVATLITGQHRFGAVDRLGMLAVALLFAGCMKSNWLQKAMSSRTLTFFGFISYPLYLIHNNILIATQAEIAKCLPSDFYELAPIAPLIILSLIAWLIAKYFEPLARQTLKNIQIKRPTVRQL